MALEQPARYEGPFLYPTDYRIFRVGEYLALKFSKDPVLDFVQVTGTDKMRPKTYQDTTNWLLATGATSDLDDLSGLLQTPRGNLGLYWMGVDCDREVEVRMYYPAADIRGGHKKKSLPVITPLTSPFYAPTVTFPCYREEYPTWANHNRTEYTLRWLSYVIGGYNYEIKKAKGMSMKTPPKHFETIQFPGIA